MSYVVYLQESSEVKAIVESTDVDEIILSAAELSRFGCLKSSQVNELASELKSLKASHQKVVLEWDILMTQSRFENALKILDKIDLNLFDAIRVQDPGAYEYALEVCDKFSNLRVHLSLETGNHNLEAIKKWIQYGGEKLEKVILSIEIPKQRLIKILEALKNDFKDRVKFELLGIGRILLFYSPRKLVSPVSFEDGTEQTQEGFNQKALEIIGSSQESPHSGFPIVENRHGTFMFHLKDHCLLDEYDVLRDAGIGHFRIDDRFYRSPEFNLESLLCELSLNRLVELEEKERDRLLKAYWPCSLIKGFFRANKSDVLFKKLKNSRLQNRDESYIGDVVDVQKDSHIAFIVKAPSKILEVGQRLRIYTPDGKEKSLSLDFMKNGMNCEVDKAATGDIVFLRPVSGVSIRSMVYLDS